MLLPRGMGERGTWKLKQVPGRPVTAEITCPECGKRSSMADHSIDSKGQVTPSIICPHVPCAWHENVILAGWPGEPAPVTRAIYRGGIPS